MASTGVQLPHEALGSAIGVLIYAVITLLASILLFALAWSHERFSYVAVLSVFTGLSSGAGVARIVICMMFFREIATSEWEHAVSDPGRPAMVVFGPAVGLNLTLLSIQFYAWQVQALTVSCWAFELCLSVFPVKPRRSSIPWRPFIKVAAALLPALDIAVLHLTPLEASLVGYLVVANALIAFGLVSSALLLMIMLFRYVHVRRQASLWKPSSKWTSEDGVSTAHSSRHTYDRWLVLRFTIGFVAMGAFEIVMILFEFLNLRAAEHESVGKSPDLSPSAAAARFPPLIPQVSAGLIAFVVFGTTGVYREYMRRKLVLSRPSRPAQDTSRAPIAAVAPRLEGGKLSRTELQEVSFSDDVLHSFDESEMSRNTSSPHFRAGSIDVEDRAAWHSYEKSG